MKRLTAKANVQPQVITIPDNEGQVGILCTDNIVGADTTCNHPIIPGSARGRGKNSMSKKPLSVSVVTAPPQDETKYKLALMQWVENVLNKAVASGHVSPPEVQSAQTEEGMSQ